MAKIDELLQSFRAELGVDFIATDVVGLDGLSIGGLSANPNLDSNASSARGALVMKLATKVSDKLALGAVDDNLATTDKCLVITRFLGDGAYFWGLVVTREATLGTVRMLMNEYAPQLWDAIPH